MSLERELDEANLDALIAAEATGYATAEELAILQSDPDGWVAALHRLVAETDEALRSAAGITGDERDQVLDDLRGERQRLIAALRRLGQGVEEAGDDGDSQTAALETPQPPELQGSWSAGRIVVWAGGAAAWPASVEELDALLSGAGADTLEWQAMGEVAIPGGKRAKAQWAPIDQTLGWLVAVGSGQLSDGVAPSLRWLGDVAVWATELVAQGRMVPTLRRSAHGEVPNTQSAAGHRVRWVPALVDAKRLRQFTGRMPGAVAVLDASMPAESVCRSVLAAVVDAVCRAGAARLVTPAATPAARTRTDIAEAVLSGLDGGPFRPRPEPAGRPVART